MGVIHDRLEALTNQDEFNSCVHGLVSQVLSPEIKEIKWKRTREGMSGQPDYQASVDVTFQGQRDNILIFLYLVPGLNAKCACLSLLEKEKIVIYGTSDPGIDRLFEKVSGMELFR